MIIKNVMYLKRFTQSNIYNYIITLCAHNKFCVYIILTNYFIMKTFIFINHLLVYHS